MHLLQLNRVPLQGGDSTSNDLEIERKTPIANVVQIILEPVRNRSKFGEIRLVYPGRNFYS
jgi:hypothetical protein